MKVTQCDLILDYMRQYGSISTLEAFIDLGVARLASRIHDLKQKGYIITDEIKTAKNRRGKKTAYKVYKLVEEKK